MGMNTDFKCNIGNELFLSSCSAAAMLRNRRDPKSTPRCVLDAQGCLSLGNILESFNVAINEEHAWAITFQFAKTGQSILSDPERRKLCHVVSKTDHVKLSSDGQVHEVTFLPHLANNDSTNGKVLPRTKCACEYRIISKMAMVLFTALDHGLQDEEERHLSPDIVALLDAMACAEENARPETDDEGIEKDSGDSDDDRAGYRVFNFKSILEQCRRRLSSSVLTPTNNNASGSNNNNNNNSNREKESAAADAHYKAVCRALVTEALELSTFLEKVSEGTQQLVSSSAKNGSGTSSSIERNADLDKLQLADWARLWVQVIRELRNGVKLKKVDSSYLSRQPPIEYALTPYEILMDDIRSRRYKLKKVVVEELPQRVKKDAHAVILEFIRSRPPLRKSSERVLRPPPVRKADPVEALMESIRKEHHLRPTKVNSHRHSFSAASSYGRQLDMVRNRERRFSSSDIMEVAESDSSTTGNSSDCLNNNNFIRVPSIISENSSLSTTETTTESHALSLQSKRDTLTQPQRRLIKADLDLLYSLDLDSRDDDDEDDADRTSLKSNSSNLSQGGILEKVKMGFQNFSVAKIFSVNKRKPV